MAPDATAETFREATEHGGGEDADGRRARYLSWTLPPALGETSFETHYSFLLREPDGGPVEQEHRARRAGAARGQRLGAYARAEYRNDVHREGLFGRATWLRLFGEVGLAASLEPRKIEGEEYDSFVALRAAT